MIKPLSKTQQRVFDALNAVPDTDVSLYDLYKLAYPDAGAVCSPRYMQQSLGPVVSRINAKLDAGAVRPGVTKQTYRFYTNVK